MIEVQNDLDFAVDSDRLEAAILMVLQQHDRTDASMTLVLALDEMVADLNRQFRGVDSPTDVLSFPTSIKPDNSSYLGDVIIAYPYAAEQARREDQDVTESLMLLAIHGTLHLLGYDHDTSTRRAAMWAAQDETLTALLLPLDLVPALEFYESND